MSNILNLVKMSYTNLNSMKKVLYISMIIFFGGSIYDPTFLNLLLGMFVYTTLYQVMAYEDTYEINKLIGYLPVTRKEYIASRYVLGLTALIVGIAVFTLAFTLSTTIGKGDMTNINYKIMLLTGITSAVFLLSVSIPMVLKFGAVNGRILLTVVTLSIIFIPIILVNDVLDPQGINNLLKLLNSNGITMILTGISLFTLFISYTISNNIFCKKSI